ncbi:hypothetical protein BGZ79_010613 [Entomortierella chlamydospora]|nr:hypothetical protein BGZ79_010613 [Entomortierella chlamydospora]
MFERYPRPVVPTAKALEALSRILKDAEESKEDPEMLSVFCYLANDLLSDVKKKFGSRTGKNIPAVEKNHRELLARAYYQHAELLKRLGDSKTAKKSQDKADALKNDSAPSSKKKNEFAPAAKVPESIFETNIQPSRLTLSSPGQDSPLDDTRQLFAPTVVLGRDTHERAGCSGAKLAREDEKTEEESRLKTLARDLIAEYMKEATKDKANVAEIICLVPVLEEPEFRSLLLNFVNTAIINAVHNPEVLAGLGQLIYDAPADVLRPSDLVSILEKVRHHLMENTHDQPSEKGGKLFDLTKAVSIILDAMVTRKVVDLKNLELHEPLFKFLRSLRKHNDPYLKYYAAYAFQALLWVPHGELLWKGVARQAGMVIKGVSGVVSAVKGINLTDLIASLKDIHQGFEGTLDVMGQLLELKEDVDNVFESGKVLEEDMKDTFRLTRRRAWYMTLRGMDKCIESGAFLDFKQLICEAPCRLELEFQWGVCERLGNLAASSLWDSKIRLDAATFLGQIYSNDDDWTRCIPIKTYILDIFNRLTKEPFITCLPAIKDVYVALATVGDEEIKRLYRSCAERNTTAYPLKVSIPDFPDNSLLDKVQKKLNVEVDIRRLRDRRFNDRRFNDSEKKDVYVQPRAKADLQASDSDGFPLHVKYEEFLYQEEKQLLLILGSSGAGKSTFLRQLEVELWKQYTSDSCRIPLFISLLSIERPSQKLIEKHLKLCEFSPPKIRAMKNRKFVVFCDGYDEGHYQENLHRSNGFHLKGGWDVKMVISCRTERLGDDYLKDFQPVHSSSDPDPFQQAVLVPFGTDEIDDYITQYVTKKKPSWDVSEYEDAMNDILGLSELVTNPFLMSLALDVLPRLCDPGPSLPVKTIHSVELYDEFMDQWLERSKDRFRVQKLNMLEEEAFESLKEGNFFFQRCREYLQDLSTAIYEKHEGFPVVEYSRSQDNSNWKEEFFGRKDYETRLLLKACPIESRGGQLRFTHRSILEYSVSLAIFAPRKEGDLKLEALKENKRTRYKKKTYPSFKSDEQASKSNKDSQLNPDPNNKSPLTTTSFVGDRSVLQFLVDRLKIEAQSATSVSGPAPRPFQDQLLAYIEASKSDPKYSTAAANAITILVQAQFPFNGKNLKNIKVPGADLSTGIFDSANLQGADLTDTNFRAAWLQHADLRDACLVGARFGESPMLNKKSYKGPCTYSPDGRSFIASNAKDVFLFDTSLWNPVSLSGYGNQHCKVTYTAFSPKRSLIAIGAQYGQIDLWDARSGSHCDTFYGHKGKAIQKLVFSSNGLQLLSSGGDRTMHLWDVKNRTSKGFSSPDSGNWAVADIMFSRRGQPVVAFSQTTSLVLYGMDTSESLKSLQRTTIPAETTPPIQSAVFSPDRRYLVVFKQETIEFWNCATGNHHTPLVLDGKISSAFFSPKGKRLAIVYADGQARVYNTRICTEVGKGLKGRFRGVTALAFSPGEDQIAVGDGMAVQLWDIETGTPGPILHGHTAQVQHIVFAPCLDQYQISSRDSSGTIKLWDTPDSTETNRRRMRHDHNMSNIIAVPNSLCRISYSTCSSNTFIIWNIDTKKILKRLDSGQSISAVIPSPNGDQFALLCSDGTLTLRDIDSGEIKHTLKAAKNIKVEKVAEDQEREKYFQATLVVFSLGGHHVALSDRQGKIKVWNSQTGGLVNEFESKAPVSKLLFDPENDWRLATAGYNQPIQIWDIKEARCLHQSKEVNGVPLHMAYLDGSRIKVLILVRSHRQQRQIYTWHIQDPEFGPIVANVGCHGPVSFTVEGDYLIGTNGNHVLRMWNATEAYSQGQGYKKNVDDLSDIGSRGVVGNLSLDGRILPVYCSTAEIIQIWDLSMKQVIATLKTSPVDVTCLAYRMDSTGVTLVVDDEAGDITVWKLIKLKSKTATATTKGGGGKEGVDEGGDDYSGGCQRYRVELLSTTANYKLNLLGVNIEGAKVGATNAILLKQFRAKGTPALYLQDDLDPQRDQSLSGGSSSIVDGGTDSE